MELRPPDLLSHFLPAASEYWSNRVVRVGTDALVRRAERSSAAAGGYSNSVPNFFPLRFVPRAAQSPQESPAPTPALAAHPPAKPPDAIGLAPTARTL